MRGDRFFFSLQSNRIAQSSPLNRDPIRRPFCGVRFPMTYGPMNCIEIRHFRSMSDHDEFIDLKVPTFETPLQLSRNVAEKVTSALTRRISKTLVTMNRYIYHHIRHHHNPLSTHTSVKENTRESKSKTKDSLFITTTNRHT
jgi:hypothetical protein